MYSNSRTIALVGAHRYDECYACSNGFVYLDLSIWESKSVPCNRVDRHVGCSCLIIWNIGLVICCLIMSHRYVVFVLGNIISCLHLKWLS